MSLSFIAPPRAPAAHEPLFPDSPGRAVVGTPEFGDWKWQMSNRIRTPEALARWIRLSPADVAAIQAVQGTFSWHVTPYYASLMDRDDPRCPIRLQAAPAADELDDPEGEWDPLMERNHSPVHDLVHVYPDRVAFCLPSACHIICRHCFRKRRFDLDEDMPQAWQVRAGVAYIQQTPAVRDVLLTGGDPLSWLDHHILGLVAEVRAIPHVEIIRIGSRAPVTCPMRVTPELAAGLRAHAPVFFNTHFNHPAEFTPEAAQACANLVDAGLPVGNQAVLLAGVNDDLETMRRVCHGLLKMRVRPYYIFHAQVLAGTRHLRVPIERGLGIHMALEGYTSGLGVPLYILDTPFGKTPLSPGAILARNDHGFLVRCFRGDLWFEPNPRPAPRPGDWDITAPAAFAPPAGVPIYTTRRRTLRRMPLSWPPAADDLYPDA